MQQAGMRIGIASEWIGARVGGVERYAADLIRNLLRVDLVNRYELFTTRRGARSLRDVESGRVAVRATSLDSRWYFVPIGLPVAVAKYPVDLLHATFSIVPWCPTKRVVLTIHDVGPDVHPEFFPAGIRYRFRWLVSRGVTRASRVIVPTQATKRELMQHYQVAPEKVTVVPEGVIRRFDGEAASPFDTPIEGWFPTGDFILAVGRFHGRKNLERLLHAFALLKRRRGAVARLVLVGSDMYHRRHVMAALRALGLDEDVACPGYVSDATLGMLYRTARLFAFPSLHEGFGIPPLEAMARGLPVLAGNRSAMPEVLGDAALLVDPYSVEEMAAGLERLLYDDELRRCLIERGKERVRHYSWEAAARATLKVYEDLLATA